jgi:hypothetical protein
MANQMIALGVRGPQVPDISRVNQQYGQIMNMMMQQRAAERQAAQAQQAMQIAAAEEGRKRDLHPSAMSEASAKAASAELKTGLDFNNFIRAAIASSATPDQVVGFADKIASLPQFQTPMYQDVLSRAVADMPRDPAQFEGWKKTTYLGTLEADKLYKQRIVEQNLGTSTRAISMSEFGGPATVVPGSEAEVKMKPVITTIDGNSYFIDPETNVAYPAAVGNVGGSPPVGAGGRGTVGDARGNSADVVYGFGQFAQPPKPISSMTIGEVQNFQKNELIPATRGKIGAGPDKGTGAVGTYQIVYGTLKDYAPKVLGPNWRNTPFTADVQDRIAKAIYEDVKNGNLKDTWAGLPANRPGAYSKVPWEQVRDQIAAVESGGGRGAAPAGGGAPKTISQAETERGFKKTLDLFGYNPKTGEDTITPLIKASTSGGLERIGSEIVGFATGEATPGRVAIGQLKALKDNMVFEKLRGKLGAQISDADVRLIASTMADIANPDIPSNERALAWQNIVLPILIRGAGMEPPVKRAPPPKGGGKRKPPIESFGGR